jgi:hypothetical protein
MLQNPGRYSWRWSWTRLGRGTHSCFGALSNAEGSRYWNGGQFPSRMRIVLCIFFLILSVTRV